MNKEKFFLALKFKIMYQGMSFFTVVQKRIPISLSLTLVDTCHVRNEFKIICTHI